MSRILSKNTGPEMIVRRIVHGLGYRYRLHINALPGRPDIVFAGRKKVIFVHGCFWHLHTDCRQYRLPKSRQEFWLTKLNENVKRDERNQKQLLELGWDVLVIWECELKDKEVVVERVISFLEAS